MTTNNNQFFDGPIPPELISEIISNHSEFESGAYSIFLGKVRADSIDNKIVKQIEYSVYSPLAENIIEEIINQIIQKFDDLKTIKIIHSKGIVKAGEFSLLVIISCGHRKQSFDAVQETVELIKEKLPVWKKEIFEDGTYGWPGNKS
jgi:molybdopterin synthase catalytic subunit